MSYSDKYHRLSKENISKHQGKSSSFWMHDPEMIFGELNLTEGSTFLDLGCGVGKYSIYASKIIGDTGKVYALDQNETLIQNLKEESVSKNMNNIFAINTNVTNALPLDDKCIDVCLIATVLHCIDKSLISNTLKEVRRVMKSSGRLFTIDCSKKDGSFGPPMSMRLTPKEIKSFAALNGFQVIKILDLGFNYMICFERS